MEERREEEDAYLLHGTFLLLGGRQNSTLMSNSFSLFVLSMRDMYFPSQRLCSVYWLFGWVGKYGGLFIF